MEDIGRILNTGMREIVFSVSSVIYKLIIMFYEIFDFLCGRRLFDNEMLQTFIERISVILGIVMLFIVIFSFIKMLVDPDKINDKEFGATSTIKKIIIVIVMLGMSSFAFNALYYVQDVVIEENIISKLILPISIDEENSDKFGNVLASGLFMSFYQIDEMMNDVDSDNVLYCNNIINQLDDQIALNGNFSLGRECLTQTEKIDLGEEKVEVFVVDYNYLLSLVVGGVVVYLVFSYCISVGIRMIQLLFLEIISPMAIVSYLMPKKDTMFNKWLKIYIATYVDVFIRIAIINFIIFIIASIFAGANLSFGLDNFNGNFWSNSVLLAIIVIALLTFAKKAPDLLKELFPAGASKLGFGPSLSGFTGIGALFGGLAGGVIGASAGLTRMVGNTGKAVGLLKNGWNTEKSFAENLKANKNNLKGVGKAFGGGVLGAAGVSVAGLARGGFAGKGAKGIGAGLKAGQQAQAKANIATAQRLASGVSTSEMMADKARGFFGIQTGIAGLDKRISENQAVIDAVNGAKSVKAFNDQLENVKENIAIKRNDTELKFLSDMKAIGIDNNLAIDYAKKIQMERFIKSDEFGRMTTDEKKEYLSEFKSIQDRTKNVEGVAGAKDLAINFRNDNDAYDAAIKRSNKRVDNMADAVFYLTTGDIASLEKIDGVSKEVKDGKTKYYIDGTEVTDWGSIGATIRSYNDRHGTSHKTLGAFKGENGGLREKAAEQSHRKTS